MEEGWDRSPNNFQLEIIQRIPQKMTGDFTSEGFLPEQSIESVKSFVPHTALVVTLGATMIIEPTLALSSDQSKIQPHQNVQDVLVCSFRIYF